MGWKSDFKGGFQLQNDEKLADGLKDHQLTGSLKEFRECPFLRFGNNLSKRWWNFKAF